VKNNRLQLDVAWSVHTVDVSKGSGTSEHSVGDLAEFFVGIKYILGLGVKTGRVYSSVIDAILFSSSDTKLELKKNIDLGELLHVLLADMNVFFQGFF